MSTHPSTNAYHINRSWKPRDSYSFDASNNARLLAYLYGHQSKERGFKLKIRKSKYTFLVQWEEAIFLFETKNKTENE